MKPTEKQKRILEFVSQQISFWESTNDITSPTHYGDLGEFVNDLIEDDILGEKDAKELEEILSLLYIFVRQH